VIAKQDGSAATHFRLRARAWQALGDQQQAEADFRQAIEEGQSATEDTEITEK
jgi:Tfp pilus assembly protein PilF